MTTSERMMLALIGEGRADLPVARIAWGPIGYGRAISKLHKRGLVTRTADGLLVLTDAGQTARKVNAELASAIMGDS